MSDRQQRFAETIKARRLELGLLQDDVADACGVRQPAVSAWESATKYPTVDKLELLAKVLELDVGDLLNPEPAGTGSNGGTTAQPAPASACASGAGAAIPPPRPVPHSAHPRGASAPLSSGLAANDTGGVTARLFESGAQA